MSNKDSIALVWCDNGMVDGKFMQGVADVMLKSGVKFESTLRSQGNQIARQRQTVIDYWYDKTNYEWLLWVDSDVVISPEKFKLLWDNRDAEKRPLITGVYFTTDNPEESLMEPKPTLFWFVQKEQEIGIMRVHPLPKDKLIKVGAAGMGFVLMHCSVCSALFHSHGTRFFHMGKGFAVVFTCLFSCSIHI